MSVKGSTTVPTPPRAAMLLTTLIAWPATSRRVQLSHGDGSSHRELGTERTAYSKPNRIDVYNRRFSLIRRTLQSGAPVEPAAVRVDVAEQLGIGKAVLECDEAEHAPLHAVRILGCAITWDRF